MRILLVLLVCSVLIISTSTAYAAPVGNIGTPAILKSSLISKDEEKPGFGMIAAFESDIVNDRKIDGQLGKTDVRFYDCKIGLVIADRAVVYGLLGSARLEEQFRDRGNIIKIESNTDISWGAGATVLLYEMKFYEPDESTLRFGIDGRFRNTELDADRVIFNRGTPYMLPDTDITGTAVDYKDWQIAGAVSWQWKRFVPYAGIKYSDMSGKLQANILGTKYEQDIQADEKVGIFFGADFIITEPVSSTDAILVNVEYRLVDEEALSLGCTVRF